MISGTVGCALWALSLAPGCSGRSVSHERSRGGEAGERGGSSGTQGVLGGSGGTSGSSGASGTIGIGGDIGGTGGTSGVAGDGGSAPKCGNVGDPHGTPDARRTVPFSLDLAGGGGLGNEADTEALSGAGGIGGVGSGCENLSFGAHCEGNVQTSKSAGALAFLFADGSALEWTGDTGTFVAPPDVVNGEVVYVDYTFEQPPVCPYCGSETRKSITISNELGGQLLWVGREGSRIAEVEPELIAELFGVPARRELVCLEDPFVVDCYTVTREIFDNVLETAPEQRIPHVIPTRISSPRGSYEVMWASSEQINTFSEFCADGRSPSNDRGFAASRLDRNE